MASSYFLAILDPAGNEIRRTVLRIHDDDLSASEYSAEVKGKELFRDALCREGLLEKFRNG